MYSKVIFGNTIHLEPIKWKFQYIWNPAIPSVDTLYIPERGGVKMGVLDPPLPCGSPHSIPLMEKWQLSCLQVFWQWMFCCWHDSAYWKSEPIVLSFTIDGLAAIVIASDHRASESCDNAVNNVLKIRKNSVKFFVKSISRKNKDYIHIFIKKWKADIKFSLNIHIFGSFSSLWN